MSAEPGVAAEAGGGPLASVIIRTKNEAAYLGQVLSALRDQAFPAGLEIIVVDSGSTDGTQAIAQRHGARLIEIPPETFTFGRALNVGSDAAGGAFLVNLSGHSTPVRSDYIDQLTAPLEDPAVWATFGRDVPRPDTCPSQARDTLEWFPADQVDYGRFFSNANACVRRSAWLSQPFDERLSGAEDAEWARAVLAAGHHIVYVPTAEVYHSHTPSPRFVYVRAVRETRALASLAPGRERFGLGEAYGFWLDCMRRDLSFARDRGYRRAWYAHIPIYRACQALGIFRGDRLGRAEMGSEAP